MDTCSSASVLKNAYLEKKCPNCNADGTLLILKNELHPFFNQMGELLILPNTVRINESSLANVLSFAEVANFAGVHNKIDTSKEKSHQCSHQRRKLFISKHMWRVFYTQDLITQISSLILLIFLLTPIAVYPPFKESAFILILKLKERRKI